MAGPRLTQISDHVPTETNGAKPSPHTKDGAYSVREEPLGTPKPIRIIGIGAGASGINMVRTLRLNLTDYEHVIYEKNEDVGGTWFENRYPGCRCDIPSHNYQFSWRANPEWSNFFSPAEEIEAYLCQICKDEKMMDVIKTSHKIVGARWNESKGIWEVKVVNLKTGEEFDDYANFLLDASGILNNWKWPDIEGLHDFNGTLIHSANWPKDFDYANKSVAVIGNGSTGIQIVPAIQPDVQKLYHSVRTPTWVVPPRIQTMATFGASKDILADIEIDEQENFTPEQIRKFKEDPDFYKKFVKAVEKDVNGNFPIMMKDSPMQQFASSQCRQYMTAMLGGDATLCKALIPTFPLGCRRMTPAHGYLKSLTQPNVFVLTGGMKRFVAEGIEMESGEVVKLDAIICATGFDVSFCPRFPLIGRDGNLQDIWTDHTPQAYMSCAVPGFPNYFTFMGPNAPGGHGSIFTASEHIAKYITRVIKKCQTEGVKAIAPLQEAVDDLYEHMGAFMPRTAWASSCRSWFKAGRADGPVTALHPGSRIHFFHMLETLRGEDYEYVYDHPRQNRFRYLGNGFSTKELDESVDSTWYLDESAVV
ncbi:putative phenylacetone monooxygenase protein [Phaeoacremonium minimum UCRPA7]|uniref:Putative phenylacetone monooxygenase protein n=1 Tax=Phaeoacremonium minimum (strain UCR-PA7) TaxID=1286976 RepID=R8BBZ1_PHAM7|nr:putative phenylacetone monooxygenase protein [Phaeoacremonium minimum UCRPA7]EON96822.1 putative phenylacetone monooxygenase protein [Phaeoacremonium minimum UCRPA7]